VDVWTNSIAVTQIPSENSQLSPVVLNSDGQRIYAVWSIHSTDSGQSIWAREYSNGAWAAGPTLVKKPAFEQVVMGSVNATFDAWGHGVVTWCVDIGNNTYDLLAARYADGVWSQTVSKLNDRPLKTAKADLYVDRLGQVTAVWFEGDQFAARRFE
jgi:hypothetical protein